MVITVSCPSCAATFPVDSDKVPVGGVNARCSECRRVFRVERPVEPPPFIAEPLPGFESSGFEGGGYEAADADFTVVTGAVPAPEPTFAAPPPPPLPPPPPAPEAPEPPPGSFRFGKRDPSDKARRLARVLVSDMIMYNADRHERALAAGTLKQDFEDEIARSWKEYVDQVGEQMASGNSFWLDALNDVLAKGQKVF